ncbi:hypothetical protein PAPYR_9883 [Paratrimastix pyriformis]|uniref:Uncharacterized protein n=1 Tax=Paratrimastix pyriformis TaxID=342808 RepID=A0ABQ8U9X5_9EUKA|nr:hypothetical protein PAPYR_9883 [Paratrimastix pyriformis]
MTKRIPERQTLSQRTCRISNIPEKDLPSDQTTTTLLAPLFWINYIYPFINSPPNSRSPPSSPTLTARPYPQQQQPHFLPLRAIARALGTSSFDLVRGGETLVANHRITSATDLQPAGRSTMTVLPGTFSNCSDRSPAKSAGDPPRPMATLAGPHHT